MMPKASPHRSRSFAQDLLLVSRSRSTLFAIPSHARPRLVSTAALSRRSTMHMAGSSMLAQLTPELDPITVVNSIFGAFGLPRLKETSRKIAYDDIDNGIHFQYPAAWVKRKNSLRPGAYFSNFDSGDRAVLEIFSEIEAKGLEEQLVAHFVNPGEEIGGDSRLMTPSLNRIKSQSSAVDNQAYTYVEFPSETITRSGYQIKQKNFGVAARRRGTIYTLVSSARSDKYDKNKEEILREVIQSFRLEK